MFQLCWQLNFRPPPDHHFSRNQFNYLQKKIQKYSIFVSAEWVSTKHIFDYIPLRDCWQITFAVLNRFHPLSPYPTKLKLKTIYSLSWFYKKCFLQCLVLVIPSKQSLCLKPALSQRNHRLMFNLIRPGLLRAPQAWGETKLSHLCIFSSSNSINLKFGMNIIYNEKVSKNFFCDYDVIIYDDVSILIISSPGFWESTL